jgi:8-oxo-dGTP pyrophosphatase MutT (NUDIX family)
MTMTLAAAGTAPAEAQPHPSPARQDVPVGPVDDAVEPAAVIERDRPITATLMRPGWRPPDAAITQAYGICFADGGIVLAAWAPGRWNLPGGTIEPGETPEQALVREVAEEACATVTDFEYLACQHVSDPESPTGRTSFFQSRWWARVSLGRWDPRFEMTDRTVVDPDDFVAALFWREKTIAARLLELALAAERRYA